MPRLLAVYKGAWVNDKAIGEDQVVTKELQELQSDRKENPHPVNVDILLDGAPLSSLLPPLSSGAGKKKML